MSIDDIYETLIDGSRSDIEALSGCGASYAYSPSSGGFSLWNADRSEGIRGCKLFKPPNCAAVFGNEHVL